MGTSYTIVEHEGVKLVCYEMSCRFDLDIWNDKCPDLISQVKDLPPEKLVTAAIELLKVASYNMEPTEMDAVVKAHIEKTGGYTVGVTI